MVNKQNNIELAKAASRGEAWACRLLVADHAQRLLRLVSRLLPDPSEAEEVVQDSLLRALNRLDAFDGSRGSLATWLSTIAWRTALNHLRSHPRRQTLSFEELHQEEPSEEQLDEAFSSGRPSRVEALVQALSLLSAEERALLSMRYTEELSLDEIAVITESDASALASRLYRIRKKLYNLILKTEQR